MSLIGLDIGTTGCKAIVFSTNGAILGQGKDRNMMYFPRSPTGRSRMPS